MRIERNPEALRIQDDNRILSFTAITSSLRCINSLKICLTSLGDTGNTTACRGAIPGEIYKQVDKECDRERARKKESKKERKKERKKEGKKKKKE